MSDLTTHSPPRPTRPPRTLPLVAANLAGILALLLFVAGGVALYGNGQKDEDGYLSTASHRFATDTHALATETLDVDAGETGWFVNEDRYGKVRVKVEPSADEAVFVGIARTSDVSAYLSQSAHAEVTDVSYDPFDADYRGHEGSQRPAPPAEQRIWEASSLGTGPQTLTWDVEHGAWSIVVMNADGSAGVDVGVSAGANVPVLGDVAWAAIGGGLLLVAIAGGLLYVAVRKPRDGYAGPPHVAAPAAA